MWNHARTNGKIERLNRTAKEKLTLVLYTSPAELQEALDGFREWYNHQNYPNPFNPVTTIRYDLPRDGHTRLAVYDLLGKRVAELVNERQAAGGYAVRFNGATCPRECISTASKAAASCNRPR